MHELHGHNEHFAGTRGESFSQHSDKRLPP